VKARVRKATITADIDPHLGTTLDAPFTVRVFFAPDTDYARAWEVIKPLLEQYRWPRVDLELDVPVAPYFVPLEFKV
jgi:hypothetical protein